MRLEVAEESNPDIARRILAAFRGYNMRQNFMPSDLEVLVELLDAWDRQVGGLEAVVAELQANLVKQSEQIAVLEAENDELRATSGLKGVMTYLKTRAGLANG